MLYSVAKVPTASISYHFYAVQSPRPQEVGDAAGGRHLAHSCASIEACARLFLLATLHHSVHAHITYFNEMTGEAFIVSNVLFFVM